jgi:hypothetical protein
METPAGWKFRESKAKGDSIVRASNSSNRMARVRQNGDQWTLSTFRAGALLDKEESVHSDFNTAVEAGNAWIEEGTR